MKITIITINYNDASGLKKTMDSVLNQTLLGFEYIVIDGNSTDASVEIIKSYDDKRLKWVSETDSGIYNAMNKGIVRATGDYLLFLNSGDFLINKDVLKRINLNTSTSFIGFNLYLDKEKMIEKKHPQKISFSYLLNKTIYHPSTFIKRSLFRQYGLYNEQLKIVSDWEFFFKTIALNGESFQSVDIGLTVFDMNGISSLPANIHKVENEKAIVIDKYLKSIRNSDFDAFIFNQLKAPSKRIKYLKIIEKSKPLRKLTTVILAIVSFFIQNKKK